MLKLPYAVRDFNKLITEGHVYLDRTDRIPMMERLGYELLFLRPRRFGKSLWLSPLDEYLASGYGVKGRSDLLAEGGRCQIKFL